MRSRLLQASRFLNKVGGNTFNPALGGETTKVGYARKSHGGVALRSNLVRQSNALWLLAPLCRSGGLLRFNLVSVLDSLKRLFDDRDA